MQEKEQNVAIGGEALSPVKQALLEIRRLRARVAELESGRGEPMAIVGIGIRTPGGVRNLDDFAHLLWSGTDAIAPIPADRWAVEDWYDDDAATPGRMYTREGGFLDQIDAFDAEFFGIAPVEAASLDPQQRLLLELAWEAIEGAGHSPASMAGRRLGIYLGIANSDYGRALLSRPDAIDAYVSQGNAFSVASGRLAYLFGTHGPAVSIDTACSSSLVAVHLACQALRDGDCDMALAGGINLILTPEINVNFCKAGMMSRDGRCKTFDAAADGYVRGEGGAVILLRRLRDAEADGDPVLAVIRGSAVNQDGRSNGLTAPNGPAQEAVIRAALQGAGLEPGDIGFVETHGTGTSLGDPIEVNALGSVFSDGRAADRPLLLGAVKTNIGHLEAAAGIVGLAKAVLAVQKGEVPPNLHLRTPNPYIEWSSLRVSVPVATQAWRGAGGSPRRAGVSSFGFSGTNAHLVLEEAPRRPLASPPRRAKQLLVLSGRDRRALDTLVHQHAEALRRLAPDGGLLADVCFTAAAGREHFAHRLAVRAESATAMSAALAGFAGGGDTPGVVTGVAPPRAPRVAFLFPGQGPQYLGMGRALHASEPAFRRAFDECAAILDPLLPRPLREAVLGEDAALLSNTQFAQPAMFAIEIALATLWQSWGVEPAAVMGHSFGEYAAAVVAGALPLADAARMVAARARLAQALPAGGGMTVVEAPEVEVLAAIRAAGRTDVSIGALNGPTNTVISGAREAVDALAGAFAARGARTKSLRVSHAFHSPLVEPVLDDFERELRGLSCAAPRVSLVSGLSGQVADRDTLSTSRYWRDHLREPVRFAEAMGTLSRLGITHFIEISPHPVLLGMGAEVVDGLRWLPSLREGQHDEDVLLDSLQQLWCDGVPVDWNAVLGGDGRQRVPLPTYPFQRRRHWSPALSGREPAGGPGVDRWPGVAASMDRQAERGPLELNAASYPDKWDCLGRLTRAHAIRTLREAGLFTAAGERRELTDVLAAAGIPDTYRHLIARWLGGLAAHGVLRQEGQAFVADQPLPEPRLDALWREAEQRFADNTPLLDYVRNCAQRVGAVLRGRESPLETLFPDGSFELARGLYERSTAMRYINGLAGAAFEALAAATPPGAVLRVLEIGAGTGGTTSSLLPLLPPERTRYRFTDVSDVFLAQARERFAGYPFVEYGLFDLDRELAGQGVEPGSFDAIVSANCVHATRDLRAAIARLRELLAPGGVLVLVESTVHLEYFDMTTGLIEGWQHFADDLRGDNPLLPPAVWVGALREAGFSEARAWPGEGSIAGALGQHVIVARAPGAVVAARAGTAAGSDNEAAAPAKGSEDGATQATAWRRRFDEAATADERLDVLRETVREQVMKVLGLDAASAPSGDDRLMDLGMDSLMAVQLRNGLTRALQPARPLPSTLMFDYPTIDAMAGHLFERLQAAPSTVAAAVSPDAPAAPAVDAAAVAAMSDAEIEKLLAERLS